MCGGFQFVQIFIPSSRLPAGRQGGEVVHEQIKTRLLKFASIKSNEQSLKISDCLSPLADEFLKFRLE
jgi:hypothetical protein